MMTDDTQRALAGAVNQPLPLPALKHRFDSHIWIPSDKSRSGYAQTERTCNTCGAVKVTIHAMPDDKTGRAWRTNTDAEQVETFEAPVCVPLKSNVTSEEKTK